MVGVGLVSIHRCNIQPVRIELRPRFFFTDALGVHVVILAKMNLVKDVFLGADGGDRRIHFRIARAHLAEVAPDRIFQWHCLVRRNRTERHLAEKIALLRVGLSM